MSGELIVWRGLAVDDRKYLQCEVAISQGYISRVDRAPVETAEAKRELREGAPWLAPGLIDIQVNGSFGIDVGPSSENLTALSRGLAAIGVTSYCPTRVTSDKALYPALGAAFDAARRSTDGDAACMLGLHLEGPLLDASRRGVHELHTVKNGLLADIEPLLRSGLVAICTLSARHPEFLAALEVCRSSGVVAALGHCDASFDEAQLAISGGVGLVTHLYNAMSPMHHRQPGLVGAALLAQELVCSLIVDNQHVHPGVVELTHRIKGAQSIALISDATMAAGLPAGRYSLAGIDVFSDGLQARDHAGNLAGSIATLPEVVRNAAAIDSIDWPDAIYMATRVPARLLGRTDRGGLEVGMRADLVVIENGVVRDVMLAGDQDWRNRARASAS